MSHYFLACDVSTARSNLIVIRKITRIRMRTEMHDAPSQQALHRTGRNGIWTYCQEEEEIMERRSGYHGMGRDDLHLPSKLWG